MYRALFLISAIVLIPGQSCSDLVANNTTGTGIALNNGMGGVATFNNGTITAPGGTSVTRGSNSGTAVGSTPICDPTVNPACATGCNPTVDPNCTGTGTNVGSIGTISPIGSSTGPGTATSFGAGTGIGTSTGLGTTTGTGTTLGTGTSTVGTTIGTPTIGTGM